MNNKIKNILQKYNLRGHNKKSLANNNLPISFHVIDWESLDYDPHLESDTSDESDDNSDDNSDNKRQIQWKPHDKKFIMRVYGVTAKGTSVCTTITGFTPYYFVKIPKYWEKREVKQFIFTLKNKVSRAFRDCIVRYQIVNRKKFRGFNNNRYDKFVKIFFQSHESARKYLYLFKWGIKIKNRKQYFDLYEADLDPMLRFIHINKIQSSGWIKLCKNKFKINKGSKRVSRCQLDFSIDWKYVRPKNKNTIAPLIVASFDIEADSSHGDFPVAKKDYKKLAYEIVNNYVKICNTIRKISRDKDQKDKLLELKEKISDKEEYFFNQIKLAFYPTDDESISKIFIKECNDLPTDDDIREIIDDVVYICDRPLNKIKSNTEMKAHVKRIITQFEKELEEDMGDNTIYCLEDVITEISEKVNVPYDELIVRVVNKDMIIRLLNQLFIDAETFPDVKGDEVIQIGTVVWRYGETKPYLKHIITLKSCNLIDDAVVEAFDTEREVLIRWADFIRELDPDIITGYNIFGFDDSFMYYRAEELDCVDEFTDMGRIVDTPAKLIHKQLSSSALGDNDMYFIGMNGIVKIDLLKVAQGYKLNSYKLDSVAEHFVSGSIKDIFKDDNNRNCLKIENISELEKGNFIIISFTKDGDQFMGGRKLKIVDLKDNVITIDSNVDIPINCLDRKPIWGLGKDDVSPKDIFKLQKEGPAERQIVASYCIQDCALLIRLMQKLDIITNNMGMSNVCSIPLSYIFMRGQGIKIFSLVAKECRELGFLLPVLKKLSKMKGNMLKYTQNYIDDTIDGYEGAIVLPPNPKIYFDPISVLDYSSLYPSCMISENLSHDTYCIDEEWLGEEGLIKLRSLGMDAVDITYDILEFIDPSKPQKGKRKIGEKTCRFVQYKDGKKGVIPKILMKLLGARKATRVKIKTEKDPFKKSILDGLQLAYKLTANSLYGQIGAKTSKICWIDIAASTTAKGREMVMFAKDKVEELIDGAKVVYGDSIVGDTPLLLRNNNKEIEIQTIETLCSKWISYSEFKPFDTNRSEKQQSFTNYEVWCAEGWSKIKRVIRHKTNKKIYRVNTHCGVVDVTEDHSLLNSNSEIIKPSDCIINKTELLQSYPITTYPLESYGTYMSHEDLQGAPIESSGKMTKSHFSNRILKDNNIQNYQINENKIYTTSNKKTAAEIYNLIKLSGYQPYITLFDNDKYILKCDKQKRLKSNVIRKIELLRTSYDEFVYDLETENGTFQAGVGEIIVKNTDSVFVQFKLEDDKGNKLEGEEAVKKSIETGIEFEKKVKHMLKEPHNLEYEKTFYPFILFTKKRYYGYKYEFDVNKYKENSMGIVLKRRDNAPIVKYIYGGVINTIMQSRDINKSIRFLQNSLMELINGKFDLNMLVITKTLRGFYKDPYSIAHKVLADRMGERDPGNKPQSNDRIPYVFIVVKEIPGMLQGDKIEHIDYAREYNLQPDYLTYIEKQIMKPVSQIFELIVEDLDGFRRGKGYFDVLRNKYINEYKGNMDKVKRKIAQLKQEEVKSIIFHDVLKEAEKKKYNINEITDYFKAKSNNEIINEVNRQERKTRVFHNNIIVSKQISIDTFLKSKKNKSSNENGNIEKNNIKQVGKARKDINLSKANTNANANVKSKTKFKKQDISKWFRKKK